MNETEALPPIAKNARTRSRTEEVSIYIDALDRVTDIYYFSDDDELEVVPDSEVNAAASPQRPSGGVAMGSNETLTDKRGIPFKTRFAHGAKKKLKRGTHKTVKVVRRLASDFMGFVMNGRVVELAVGLVIGAAFTTVISSLVNDIFTPILGLAVGSQLENAFIYIKPPDANICAKNATACQDIVTPAQAHNVGAVTINAGVFCQNLINFFMVALVVFGLVRAISAIRRMYQHGLVGWKGQQQHHTSTTEIGQQQQGRLSWITSRTSNENGAPPKLEQGFNAEHPTKTAASRPPTTSSNATLKVRPRLPVLLPSNQGTKKVTSNLPNESHQTLVSRLSNINSIQSQTSNRPSDTRKAPSTVTPQLRDIDDTSLSLRVSTANSVPTEKGVFPQEMQECVFCLSVIPSRALRCRYCTTDLVDYIVDGDQSEAENRGSSLNNHRDTDIEFNVSPITLQF